MKSLNAAGKQLYLSARENDSRTSAGTGSGVAGLINEGRLNQEFTFSFDAKGELVK